MADYVKDPNGVIHIRNHAGCGEFTICDIEVGIPHNDEDGPANCRDCKHQVDVLRESLKGTRFKKRLV